LSIVLSYIIQPYIGEFQSIWLSALLSLIIILVCWIFRFCYLKLLPKK
jgi:hypothetical protein